MQIRFPMRRSCVPLLPLYSQSLSFAARIQWRNYPVDNLRSKLHLSAFVANPSQHDYVCCAAIQHQEVQHGWFQQSPWACRSHLERRRPIRFHKKSEKPIVPRSSRQRQREVLQLFVLACWNASELKRMNKRYWKKR